MLYVALLFIVLNLNRGIVAETVYQKPTDAVCYDTLNFFSSDITNDATIGLGISKIFQFDSNTSLQVTAHGYVIKLDGTIGDSNMYRKGTAKIGFGSESGLGMVGDSNKEIDNTHFIQFDFGVLKSLSPAPTYTPKLQYGSAQTNGENVELYGSNDPGKLGTLLATYLGNANEVIPFTDLPEYNTYQYFSVKAAVTSNTRANVLVDGIILNCERVTFSPSFAPIDNVPDIQPVCPTVIEFGAITCPQSTSSELGVSQVFTSADGQKITARGFTRSTELNDAAMYCKIEGIDETGLGIKSDTHKEIDGNHFIELDFSEIAVAPTSMTFAIGSVQLATREGFQIYCSDTQGDLGSIEYNSQEFPAITSVTRTVTLFSFFNYCSVTANGGNVLIHSILFDCEVPDVKPPSYIPTESPVTAIPSEIPTESPVTAAPSEIPTESPVTAAPSEIPTESPVTAVPSEIPTESPVTAAPSEIPTESPVTAVPSEIPTESPVTAAPSEIPTESPVTVVPTFVPSFAPTEIPSKAPVATCPARLGGNVCNDCTQCARCVGSSIVGTKKQVTLDFTCCKNSESISWIYCKNALSDTSTPSQCSYVSGCSSTTYIDKPPTGGFTGYKCNEQSRDSTAIFSVGSSDTALTIQMHDGKFIGNEPCPKKKPTEFWAGGCGGGNCGVGSTTNACQYIIDLSAC